MGHQARSASGGRSYVATPTRRTSFDAADSAHIAGKYLLAESRIVARTRALTVLWPRESPPTTLPDRDQARAVVVTRGSASVLGEIPAAQMQSSVVRHQSVVYGSADERSHVRLHFVEAEIVPRAMAAVSSLAGALDLQVNEAAVIQNSNKLALHLSPCDAFARIALVGQEVAALEIQVARGLAAVAGPVGLLDPRVEPRVYEVDDFAVTFWTYYPQAAPDRHSPAGYADALQRLHAGMRSVAIEAPHFTERTAAAKRLVANRDDTPALVESDRHLLLSTLHSAVEAIRYRAAAEQLLHGEPHPGNLLSTPRGLVFIDFETCCIGPIEFDVAHVPDEVRAHYPAVDEVLLQESRRLVLAMVAAWRCDVHDEFPNGHHGRDILGLLREGPPWPAIGALSVD